MVAGRIYPTKSFFKDCKSKLRNNKEIMVNGHGRMLWENAIMKRLYH